MMQIQRVQKAFRIEAFSATCTRRLCKTMGNKHAVTPQYVARGRKFKDNTIYVLDSHMQLISKVALHTSSCFTNQYVVDGSTVVITTNSSYAYILNVISLKYYKIRCRIRNTPIVCGENIVQLDREVLLLHNIRTKETASTIVPDAVDYSLCAINEVTFVIACYLDETQHLRVQQCEQVKYIKLPQQWRFNLHCKVGHYKDSTMYFMDDTIGVFVDVETEDVSEVHLVETMNSYIFGTTAETIGRTSEAYSKTLSIKSLNGEERQIQVGRVIKDIILLNNELLYVTTQYKEGSEYRSCRSPQNLLDKDARLYDKRTGEYTTLTAYRYVTALKEQRKSIIAVPFCQWKEFYTNVTIIYQ